MSTDLKGTKSVLLTRFFGGKERGACIQLTMRGCFGDSGSYIQVPLAEIADLIARLDAGATYDPTAEGDDE